MLFLTIVPWIALFFGQTLSGQHFLVAATADSARRTSFHTGNENAVSRGHGAYYNNRPRQYWENTAYPPQIRGGSKGAATPPTMPTSTTTGTTNQAVTAPPVVTEPSDAIVPSTTRRQSRGRPRQALDALQTTHSQFTQVQRTTQSLKRKQFWALLALRVGFALVAPISLVGLALLFVAGTVVHATFLLTFTFCASQSRLILTSLTKAALAVLLASLCGTLLPVFAAFGLVISILQCGLELTEPLLRIRYQRQLRKIRHLHTLLTDPVLVETLQGLLRGASAVTAMTQRSLANSAKYSKRQIASMATSGYVAASSLVSTEMVEQLVSEISANSQFLIDLKEKTPPAVWKWTQQQYTSLKESGLLEAAAKQAIQALHGELEAAAEFLPYLNAIEKVRKEQQEILARQLAGIPEKQKGWFKR